MIYLKNVGIITEYNPFHNGHAYQIQKIRENIDNAGIVVAMSGSIVQRGEFSILNKWDRAEAAIKNGADLVIELPFVYACRSAQDFAKGGVTLLNELNIVNYIAFGTEYTNISNLECCAALLETQTAQEKIAEKIKSGLSYAVAVSQTIEELADLDNFNADIFKEPNTILAFEYLRSLRAVNSSIQPYAIKRSGKGHNDSSMADTLSSGTAIRQEIKKDSPDFKLLSQNVDDFILNRLKENINSFKPMDILIPLLQYRLQQLNLTELKKIYGVTEGIEGRLLKVIDSVTNVQELVNNLCTRRFPQTRCQRMLIHILLGATQAFINELDNAGPQYIRVLAFNDVGRNMLKEVKRKNSLPIINKTADFINSQDILNNNIQSSLQKMLLMDIKATNMQKIINSASLHNQDLKQSPRYIK